MLTKDFGDLLLEVSGKWSNQIAWCSASCCLIGSFQIPTDPLFRIVFEQLLVLSSVTDIWQNNLEHDVINRLFYLMHRDVINESTCSQIVLSAPPSEKSWLFPVCSATEPKKPSAVETRTSYFIWSPVDVRSCQTADTKLAKWGWNSSPYLIAYIDTFSQIWAKRGLFMQGFTSSGIF